MTSKDSKSLNKKTSAVKPPPAPNTVASITQGLGKVASNFFSSAGKALTNNAVTKRLEKLGDSVTNKVANVGLNLAWTPGTAAAASSASPPPLSKSFTSGKGNNKGGGGSGNEKAEPAFVLPGNFPPPDFKYNLPPHAWSLPVRPAELLTETGDDLAINRREVGGGHVHKTRRGIIWFWDAGGVVSQVDAEGNAKMAKDVQKEKDKELQKKNKNYKPPKGVNNYNYGFQFLWNPEQISTTIERNMDVTPSSADRFRSVSGAFPGQESYSFTIILDRVNDFACIRSWTDQFTQKGGYGSADARYDYLSSQTVTQDLINYYKYGHGRNDEAALKEKIINLSKYGTMADLEYLFKALNGDGAGKSWTTLLKKPTANIGFLSPTLLAFRFGPDATESLSFVGWITNLSINHTMFSETMIPLRTSVTFSCSAFAGAAVV